MQSVRSFLRRAAPVDAPVLLVGETGTGKSHVARRLHELGSRSEGPFVPVNCAGVPESLFESEFFGHRRGAFTGAREARQGLFEQASGGTLFLDEVGELPLRQQAKLLAVLEDGRVRRVGGERWRSVDVRVVSATCRDLDRGVEEGGFRPDLYHRLALLRCRLPPLRERTGDLLPLARGILRRVGERHGRPGVQVDPDVSAILLGHPWPGNVRELAHALEAAVILSPGSTLDAGTLERIVSQVPVPGGAGGSRGPADDGPPPKPPTGRYSFFGSPEDERELIRQALETHRGNRTRAARALGMSRTTLRSKIRRYGLEV
jgi:DNA-binding NtrC family response regulator